MFPPELTKEYPKAIKFLTNAIHKNKLANSYLFIGKDLKDTLLLGVNLAKVLNCERNEKIFSTPCNICINCKWLEKQQHPQALITIIPDSKSKKEQIKIEDIRELLNGLQIVSQYFRVVFFQNSNLQTLPPECCNLLLKTVEETPERTVFIFANTTKNDILPTILSRSQILYLSKNNTDLPWEAFTSSESLINCSSNEMSESLEKAKKAQDFIEENEINMKDYLINLAGTNYKKLKCLNPKEYCHLYEKLSSAFLRHKSFMQNKIVLEDLFLSLRKT